MSFESFDFSSLINSLNQRETTYQDHITTINNKTQDLQTLLNNYTNFSTYFSDYIQNEININGININTYTEGLTEISTVLNNIDNIGTLSQPNKDKLYNLFVILNANSDYYENFYLNQLSHYYNDILSNSDISQLVTQFNVANNGSMTPEEIEEFRTIGEILMRPYITPLYQKIRYL